MTQRRGWWARILGGLIWIWLLLGIPAEATAGSVSIAWDPNTETDLAGYKLYYGQNSRNYQFSVDVGNQTTHTLSGLADGQTYYFAVTAYDTSGNESNPSTEVSSSISGTPDTTAPTVVITAPPNSATVSGASVTVSATAADDVGVAGVQFQVDGANLGVEDTTPPYGVSWDTTTATDGAHTLTAVARDAAGNTTTSSSVLVTVDNTGQSVTPFAQVYEAEAAAVVAPMTIGSDPNALGGQYLSPTSGTNSTSPVAEATLDFTVADAGTYYLWVRILGPDGNSDALYVGIDGSWDRVFPVNVNTYEWIRVERSHNSGMFGFDLASGVHTVQMGHGEINARADALFLTNDPTEVPTFSVPGTPDTIPPATPSNFRGL